MNYFFSMTPVPPPPSHSCSQFILFLLVFRNLPHSLYIGSVLTLCPWTLLYGSHRVEGKSEGRRWAPRIAMELTSWVHVQQALPLPFSSFVSEASQKRKEKKVPSSSQQGLIPCLQMLPLIWADPLSSLWVILASFTFCSWSLWIHVN